jgi:hypothetical protein
VFERAKTFHALYRAATVIGINLELRCLNQAPLRREVVTMASSSDQKNKIGKAGYSKVKTVNTPKL